MRFLLLSLLLIGCAPAQAEEPKAASPVAVEVMPGVFVTPFDFPCGNGNTMCSDGALCINGDCITVCGTHECFVEIEAGYDAANVCPAQAPVFKSAEKLRALKAQHHSR